MAGIPPLAGFFSKMFILFTSLNNGNFILPIIVILISVISAFYYIRIIKIIYFEKTNKNYLLFIDNISKMNSILLSISSQIILFLFLIPSYFLTFFEKISLLFFL